MADLGAVVDAMVLRLQTGLAGQRIAGRIYNHGPDAISPPCIVVVPSQGEYLNFDVTFDGKDDIELVLKIIVGAQSTRAGQEELMTYVARSGAASVHAAVEGDGTLGGVVADSNISSAHGWGDVEWAGVVYFGTEIVVQVYT